MIKYVSNKYYEQLTGHIYDDVSWGPLFRSETTDSNEILKNLDNNAEKYILDSLKIMKLKVKDLKGMNVLNIGTGREARYFANQGAAVDHIDLSEKCVNSLNKWAQNKNKKVKSTCANINNYDLENNKYDVIFLAGVYQHIDIPAYALVKFINSLKPNGLMYMGFYRSGEFKFFIVDAIREFMSIKMLDKVRDANSILNSFCEKISYSTARIMDDFFIYCKHNFHPKDIIHDIKLLNAEVFHFDNDLRDYCHENKNYFSIGGDRIYITKKSDKINKLEDVEDKLKTKKGKHQLLDVQYKDKNTLKNIDMIYKIKKKFEAGQIPEHNIILFCIGLYQFTRPCNLEESHYYQETLRVGRTKMLGIYLERFIKNF